jgi:hypothetical protein
MLNFWYSTTSELHGCCLQSAHDDDMSMNLSLSCHDLSSGMKSMLYIAFNCFEPIRLRSPSSGHRLTGNKKQSEQFCIAGNLFE